MVYYVKIQKYVIWRNHMILACQNISKAFGTTEIIKNASFHIEEREKAALVGINGAGKSTLLKIIIGEMRADEGEVILSKGKTMGYPASGSDRAPFHLPGSADRETESDRYGGTPPSDGK